MPFFSIIIPLYNKEKFIGRTIQSVLAQNGSDYEIVIVNDCSTDRSVEVAQQYAAPNIRIIEHAQNRGLSAARNTGIRHATADYIAFLDADDLWKPGYLSKIRSLIDAFPVARLFATHYEELYPGGVTVLPATNLKNWDRDGIVPDFFDSSLGQPIYFPGSLCVHRSVFGQIGDFDETITYGEDVDFNIRANSVYKLAYSATALVTYTMVSQNQITQSSLSHKKLTDFDVYEPAAALYPALKRYLDFNRYIMAIGYKIEGDRLRFEALKKAIDPKSLNRRQWFLLNAPVLLTRKIKQFKSFLLRSGFRFTTID